MSHWKNVCLNKPCTLCVYTYTACRLRLFILFAFVDEASLIALCHGGDALRDRNLPVRSAVQRVNWASHRTAQNSNKISGMAALMRGCPRWLKCASISLQYSHARWPSTSSVCVTSKRSLRSPRVSNLNVASEESQLHEVFGRGAKYSETGFGATRLDRDNVPSEHGAFGSSSDEPQMFPIDCSESPPPSAPEDTEGIVTKARSKVHLSQRSGDSAVPAEASSDAVKDTNATTATTKKKKKQNRDLSKKTIPVDNITTVVKAKEVDKEQQHAKPFNNALDAVKETRRGFEEEEAKLLAKSTKMFDSQGFRLIRAEIEPQLELMDKAQILKSLQRRVIFDSPEVLVLDKPCGMSMHGGGDVGMNSKFALTAYLPELAQLFRAEKLYTVHRLDKEATGVLCLAKHREMADVIESMFKAQQIKKEYVAITRGVPKERASTIELPIAAGTINGRTRMVIVPRPLPESKKSVPKFPRLFHAVTEYKVASSSDNAAYLKLKPLTGYKHQIRVHLGFGLICPILGDHKYSHIKKLVPQKLPGDMLSKLQIRQEKVREVPLHLHSCSLVIPGILEGGRNLVVHSKVPKLFRKNLERLHLA